MREKLLLLLSTFLRQGLADLGLQVRVDLAPVGVDALFDILVLNRQHLVGDVVDEALLFRVVEDVAVERTGLTEVVVLSVLDVGLADQVGTVRVRVDVEILRLAVIGEVGGGILAIV